ncbi:MAG: ABC transporter ATP-binding protein [Oscillospiraceae bacterium]|nr:ABC transporter ATP-binding protein [Oscillospiraceae bacterium]
MENGITLQGIGLTYQTQESEVEALRDVSFSVSGGEFVALVGPSGCGKSTLLGVIAGLEQPDSGTVTVCGEVVRGPSRRVGFMPQRDQLFSWRTIRDNVLLGLQIRREHGEEHRRHVDVLLSRYGLDGFARLYPGQLSGGMRQRCALIRTLATDPDLLLLDEPFSALDYQTRLTVSGDIWRIIRSEGKTALLVTHDIAEAVSMADRVVVLSQRPAVVKAIFDMGPLRSLPPLQRRESPLFSRFFDSVWKELELQ